MSRVVAIAVYWYSSPASGDRPAAHLFAVRVSGTAIITLWILPDSKQHAVLPISTRSHPYLPPARICRERSASRNRRRILAGFTATALPLELVGPGDRLVNNELVVEY